MHVLRFVSLFSRGVHHHHGNGPLLLGFSASSSASFHGEDDRRIDLVATCEDINWNVFSDGYREQLGVRGTEHTLRKRHATNVVHHQLVAVAAVASAGPP